MKRKKSRTITIRIITPVLLAMCLLVILFFGILLASGTFTQLRANSYDTFNEWTAHAASNMESLMNNTWSNIQETENRVNLSVKNILATNGKTYDDISKPFSEAEKGENRRKHINEIILEEIAEDLVYMLRKNSVTHAMIVLDGPGVQNQGEDYYKGGIVIFDRDPSTMPANNSDLEMLVGSSVISGKLGITQSNSDPTFRFSQSGDKEREAFFFEPLRVAREGLKNFHGTIRSVNYAYWSPSFQLTNDTEPLISYSLPLISERGYVYGILSVGITTEYLNGQMIRLNSDDSSDLGVSLSIVDSADENGKWGRMNSISSKGGLIQNIVYSDRQLELMPAEFENSYTIRDVNDLSLSVNTLTLYSSNSPFARTQWAIVGFIKTSKVLYLYHFLITTVAIASAVAILVALAALLFVLNHINTPVRKLADDVKSYSVTDGKGLRRTYIKEIDMLADAFLEKSVVAETIATKVSNIIASTTTPIGVFECVRGAKKVFVSRSMFELMGWKDEPTDYIDAERFDKLMPHGAVQRIDNKEEDVVYRLKGQNKWVQISSMDDGNKIIGVIMDVTKETLEKRRIEYERDFDVLTGIHNRRYFTDRIQQLFADREMLRCSCMIAYDLDELKYVNDTYGHDYGDRYIQLMANSLQSFQKYNALVAHLSGDEFSVFLYGFESMEAIEAVIEENRRKLVKAEMKLPNGENFALRVSGGYAFCPCDADTPEELSKYADFAMYCVKHTDKGKIARFDKTQYRNSEAVFNGQEEFYDIMENKKVEFAFQPIVDARSGKIFAYEALMRPQGRTLTSPLQILEIARRLAKLSMVESLTWECASEAFARHCRNKEMPVGVKVFVNSINDCILSQEELERTEALYGNYLSHVVLEIMENAPVTSALTLEKKTQIIEKWNGAIAIDDFGTAYNGEAVLLMTNPAYVKIDMSIISGIDQDYDKQSILSNMIAYMHGRGIKIISEGVETEEEMRTLCALGIDYMQGYWIGKPRTDRFDIEEEVSEKIRSAQKGTLPPPPDYIADRDLSDWATTNGKL